MTKTPRKSLVKKTIESARSEKGSASQRAKQRRKDEEDGKQQQRGKKTLKFS